MSDSTSYEEEYWYGNGAGLIWSSQVLEKYQKQASELFLQHFGGGIESPLPSVVNETQIDSATPGDLDTTVALRPIDTSFHLQPDDNTIALVLTFDSVHWVMSLADQPTCMATIQIPIFNVRLVFEPGRDVSGNVTLSMKSTKSLIEDLALQLDSTDCPVIQGEEWQEWIDTVFQSSVHTTLTAPTIAAEFETIMSRFFGLSVVSRFRTQTQDYPVDPGWVDVQFDSMSKDGTDPPIVVGPDRALIPMATRLGWLSGDCGLDSSTSIDQPSASPAPILSPQDLDTDGVFLFRQKFVEDWIHALGKVGLWCRSVGFSAASGLVLEDIQDIIVVKDVASLDWKSPISVRTHVLEKPTIAWSVVGNELLVNFTLPKVRISFYVHAWDTDWLLHRDTWSIHLKEANVDVSDTGVQALRLQGGVLQVENDADIMDSAIAEILFSTVSNNRIILPMPAAFTRPVEPVRWSQESGYLMMHFNLMDDHQWQPMLENDLLPQDLTSQLKNNSGCGTTWSDREQPGVMLILVLGIFLLFYCRRSRVTGD